MAKLSTLIIKNKSGKDGRIKRLMHMHVGGFEKPRSKKNIHASDLTKQEKPYCPRKQRLLDIYEVKDPDQFVDTALEMTFAEGRAKQKLLNEVWLRDFMVGGWRCPFCRRSVAFDTYAGAMSKINTQKDHECQLEYVEVRVNDPVTGHSGGLDGLIIMGKGEKLRLAEIKIMGTDQFKTLKAPLAEHLIRTQLYLRTIARSKQDWAKQVDTTEASVLYLMRGHGMKDADHGISPLKEFTVKRDHKGVQDYAARAHALTASRKYEDKGFPCGTCKSMMQEEARTCPVSKQCFGPKHPGTITWTKAGKPHHSTSMVRFIVDGTTISPLP